jgi:molybdopterin-containing oxidoreductase family iron-sulfur binding subunit
MLAITQYPQPAETILFTQGVDSDMIRLVDDLNEGRVKALICITQIPPIISSSRRFISGLQKTDLTVSLSYAPDETSALCRFICPSNHYLESWGDAEPALQSYALQQPLINPIFNTRQWEESLLKWSGNQINFKDYLMDFWQRHLFPKQNERAGFYDFWVHTLQKGIFEPGNGNGSGLHPVPKPVLINPHSESNSGIELHLYQSVALTTGRHANNPWLQELPDPVTKTTWENFAALSPQFAADNGLEEFDLIEINGTCTLPVLIQPGQAYGTVSAALGYGRNNAGKVARGLGSNAYPLAIPGEGTIHYTRAGITFRKTSQKHTVARSQVYSSLDGKAIVREATLAEYKINPTRQRDAQRNREKACFALC